VSSEYVLQPKYIYGQRSWPYIYFAPAAPPMLRIGTHSLNPIPNPNPNPNPTQEHTHTHTQ